MIKMKNTFLAKATLLIVFLLVSSSLPAKDLKPFTFEDAMGFKTVRRIAASADGKWFGFAMVPDRGDPSLKFTSTSDTTSYFYSRGTAPRISKNSLWAAFQVLPKAIDIENAKTPKDKPKNTFSILNLTTGKTVNKGNISKFEFSNDGKWLAYQDAEPSEEKDKKLKDKKIGSSLFIRHLNSGTDIRIDQAGEFKFDSLSNFIFYTINANDGEGDGLYGRRLDEPYAPEFVIKAEDKTIASNIEWSERAKSLAFDWAPLNETGTAKDFSLYFWNAATPESVVLLIDSINMPKKHYIPAKNSFNWTSDGKRLYFGLKPLSQKYVENAEKTKYTDSTFFNLDTIQSRADLILWHWNDPLIKTNAINRWKDDKDIYSTFMINIDDKKHHREPVRTHGCPVTGLEFGL